MGIDRTVELTECSALIADARFGLDIFPSAIVVDKLALGQLSMSAFDLGVSEPLFAIKPLR